MSYTVRERHDRMAPRWAAVLVVCLVTGLLTVAWKPGGFWNAYVLDMVGPAWTYILVRGLFTAWTDHAWTRFFSPTRTVVAALVFCFGVEAAQYLDWCEATFDPMDFVAYVALLVPLYLVDQRLYQVDRRSGAAGRTVPFDAV